jgi:hypothetical protein
VGIREELLAPTKGNSVARRHGAPCCKPTGTGPATFYRRCRGGRERPDAFGILTQCSTSTSPHLAASRTTAPPSPFDAASVPPAAWMPQSAPRSRRFSAINCSRISCGQSFVFTRERTPTPRRKADLLHCP